MLGVLGQATLKFVAVATLLFFLFRECPKFCDLAKQRRKIFSNRISVMLGITPSNVALWTARLQTCVATAEEARGIVLGGRGKEVECDETEIGCRQKGTGGHKKVVKGDVSGAVERGGILVLEDYDKIKKGPDWERRFKPLGGDDGLDVLCSQYIQRGSILYTDGARVYEQMSKNLGFSHDYVDH